VAAWLKEKSLDAVVIAALDRLRGSSICAAATSIALRSRWLSRWSMPMAAPTSSWRRKR
jgi:hypothetical protein